MMFFIISLLLLTAEIIYFRIADKFNIIDKPNLRSSHTHITLRGGGVIFLFGVWLYSAFYGFSYPWFLAGLTAITSISFIDDIRSVPNKFRIFVQFASMAMMFYQLNILTIESWWQIIIALIIFVGIINAYNFMDGINGITGGYSLAVLFPLLYINSYEDFIDTNFLITVIISVAIFCFFNFRKRAKCFAGDVGAVGIAYIILFALGRLIIGTGNLWYLLLLAVYGVDTILTIIHRLALHENIFQAHRKHLYQIMANELHIPHVVVSSIYMAIQIIVSFGIILISSNQWTYFVISVVVLCCVYIIMQMKYYHLHEQYLKSLAK